MFEKSQTTVDPEPKLLSYEDFHPATQLNKEDKDNYILTVHLPGFRTQQIIITLVRASHEIQIQGERTDAGNKRQQFNQSFKIPQNSNLKKIQAKWEKEALKIIIPKEIVIAGVKNNGERQINVSAGVAALVGMTALAGAALGAYVCCIIGSKS